MANSFEASGEARLPTRLWVDALRRRAESAGAFATVIHRGDDDRGDVLIQVVSGRIVRGVFGREFQLDGQRPFVNLIGEADGPLEASELIDRRRSRDPDLWVIEVDDIEGRHFLTEDVLERGQ